MFTETIVKFENNTQAKTVTFFAVPANQSSDIVSMAKQESEWANAQVTFTAEEFKAASNKADFLRTKAAQCAGLAPRGLGIFFDYSEDLARLIAKAEGK